MKVEFTFSDPESAWIIFREQIESIPDLRKDVILEVSRPVFPEDRTFRFVDNSGIPIPTTRGPDPLLDPERFLAWLEMKFGPVTAL